MEVNEQEFAKKLKSAGAAAVVEKLGLSVGWRPLGMRERVPNGTRLKVKPWELLLEEYYSEDRTLRHGEPWIYTPHGFNENMREKCDTIMTVRNSHLSHDHGCRVYTMEGTRWTWPAQVLLIED